MILRFQVPQGASKKQRNISRKNGDMTQITPEAHTCVGSGESIDSINQRKSFSCKYGEATPNPRPGDSERQLSPLHQIYPSDINISIAGGKFMQAWCITKAMQHQLDNIQECLSCRVQLFRKASSIKPLAYALLQCNWWWTGGDMHHTCIEFFPAWLWEIDMTWGYNSSFIAHIATISKGMT